MCVSATKAEKNRYSVKKKEMGLEKKSQRVQSESCSPELFSNKR